MDDQNWTRKLTVVFKMERTSITHRIVVGATPSVKKKNNHEFKPEHNELGLGLNSRLGCVQF